MSGTEGREYETTARTAAKLLEDTEDHVAFVSATMDRTGYVQTAQHALDNDIAYPAQAVLVAGIIDQLAEENGVSFERAAADLYDAVLNLGGDPR